MDCVIRVIQGVDKGLVHAVPEGAHVIGRGNKATIRLTPEEISWEHAVITREGEEYFVENLSALGTWVGDAKITGKVRLRPRDKIRLSGDSVVRLESATGGGAMGGRGVLAMALTVMIGLAVSAIFFSNEVGKSDKDDWGFAYETLTPWLDEQIAKRSVAPEAGDLFKRAWRLEQSEDYDHSSTEWVRLQIVLAGSEKALHCMELAGQDPKNRALATLLKPTPGKALPDEELPAAMAQFIRRRLLWADSQSSKTGLLKRF